MPSKIFQPLLYDTFEYKPATTTYHDTFKWKRIKEFKHRVDTRRAASAKVNTSTTNLDNYNNVDNVNFDLNVKEIALRSKSAAPSRASNHERSSRSSNTTTNNNNNVVENNNNNNNVSTSPAENVDDQLASLAQRYLKTPSTEKKGSHWLQYPQEDTPKYIIDAKKRLGQIHPRTPPHVKQPETASLDDVISHQTMNVNLDPSQKAINPHVPKHFLVYDCPDTPEHIREIRRRFRDERYKRDDKHRSVSRMAYSSLRPEELSKYVSDVIKPATSIPTPNLQTQELPPRTPLQRSKTSMGFEKSNNEIRSEEFIQKLQVPQQQSGQQPITIIYNHFQAPSPVVNNATPEYLATLANNLAAVGVNAATEAQTAATVEAIENAVDLENEKRDEDEQHEDEIQQQMSSEYINTEWDRYYGYYNKDKKRSESKCSVKAKAPTPTLNDVADQAIIRPATVMSIQTNGRKTPSIVIVNQNVKRTPSVAGSAKSGGSSKPPLPPQNDQQQVRKETPAPTTFDGWLQNANEKEKEIVLGMLRSLDGIGPRPPSAAKSENRVATATYGIRTRPPSSKRKLGQTRNLHKFPCEICERTLIKQHIWDISKCVNCGGCGTRPMSASSASKLLNAENEGYSNTTSHFTNSMPTWRGQYVIHPDFTSENRDFQRIYTNSYRPKSSKI